MNEYKALRESISYTDKELLIYATDTFSQFPQRDASENSKCDRVLPVACRNDLVILREELDMDYYSWLRSHGLGSDYVVEYKAQSKEKTLSELIIENPEPIKNIIKKTSLFNIKI